MAEGDIAAIKAQALEKCAKLFDDADTNGDGQLDRTEMMGQAASQFNGTDEQKQAEIDKVLAEFDTNNDGKISREEWLAFFGKLFDSMVAAGLESA